MLKPSKVRAKKTGLKKTAVKNAAKDKFASMASVKLPFRAPPGYSIAQLKVFFEEALPIVKHKLQEKRDNAEQV